MGTASRARSPDGGSNLMTDAPRSRRILTQCGPAKTRVKSSTRIPSSGRVNVSDPLSCSAGRLGAIEDRFRGPRPEEGLEASLQVATLPNFGSHFCGDVVRRV